MSPDWYQVTYFITKSPKWSPMSPDWYQVTYLITENDANLVLSPSPHLIIIITSTDEEPKHPFCPIGDTSWCKYQ
ncbi:hypothetical protein TNCV_4934241 [Trichonephila clavipes]|nr:hypothetical protein TNCV_4934241 [Trichonephila clavipes]